ncbi:hypothetical protein ACIBG8_36315 [Nonomuraea sp. NPDC050556]|uniref:hypothetical protein n=1 Tax=Nonomuraea sp. NPDC050556 TaxID=3364369 RepID=UPI0037AEB528
MSTRVAIHYSRAYPMAELAAFPGFPSSDGVAYIRDDYTVAGTPFPDAEVIFKEVTPDWRTFCTEVLSFIPEP